MRVYTKYLSELVGTQGPVYSIEPIPLTFDILCLNVKKLGLKNIEQICCAISDTDGTATMEVPVYDSSWENFHGAKIVDETTDSPLSRERVESKTMDLLFSELLRKSHYFSFIKCDVEGHEYSCIKGAMNITKISKPIWEIGVSEDPDDSNSNADRTFKLLTEQGCETHWFGGTSLKRRSLGEKSVNYFYRAREHLQSLQEQGFLTLDYLFPHCLGIRDSIQF
ncbi:MAG: FkbM family methyltransferase [Bacteroidota bacterium]